MFDNINYVVTPWNDDFVEYCEAFPTCNSMHFTHQSGTSYEMVQWDFVKESRPDHHEKQKCKIIARKRPPTIPSQLSALFFGFIELKLRSCQSYLITLWLDKIGGKKGRLFQFLSLSRNWFSLGWPVCKTEFHMILFLPKNVPKWFPVLLYFWRMVDTGT